VQVQPSLIPVESADAEPAETDLAQVELPQAEPAEASGLPLESWRLLQ
jgi:hypothetical protein